MRNRTMLAGLALMTSVAGCNNFLDATRAVEDPNKPTTANRNTLFPGAAANLMDLQEGVVAMMVCEWMQQCAGQSGRFVEEFNKYNVNGTSFDLTLNDIYAGGGLVALRDIQASATADGDLVSRGVAEVVEAVNMMWAADMLGDIPYSEFEVGKTDAAFDGQMAIYASLQTLLDRAIADLAGAGAGPLRFDVFYAGDKGKWTRLAHTLKARLALHTVEKLGTAQYSIALAQANLGVNAADGSDDFRAAHTANTSERNLWHQFQLSSFGADLVAGARLVDLMKAQGDPRLPEYFGKNTNGGYGGADPLGTAGANDISPIAGSGRTENPVFAQPLVTWEENQLIKAEASFVLSGAAAAQPFLDAVRAAHGKTPVPATLQSIMEEKYINLYQNVESWNDFKRTCYPRLVPTNTAFTVIPGRIPYWDTEKQTNPKVPSESPLQTARNANDPNPCPTS
jgi:starch-binding outer membrane protein, SusD/RagB family